MGNKNLICTSIDDNYLWPWMVMVYSAAINSNDNNFRIVIANMNGMLSREAINIIEVFTKSLGLDLEILDIKTSLNPTFAYQANLTNYSRLFLMDALEEDFFWFDADLILMPGWDKIFVESSAKLNKDEVICGVLDAKISRQKKEKELNQAYVRTDGGYINSGVMKIYVKNWKKLHKKVDWKEMALTRKEYGFTSNDQDIINYLCAKQIIYLSAGFNYIVGDEISFKENILIKHYAGAPKPWQLNRVGKEFILAVQGAKYFKPQDWITQSSDAFLHYPMYWQVEEELLTYTQNFSYELRQQILDSRSRCLKKLDVISLAKHYCIQFVSRRFFQ
jgi:lipopolysaccharide biosynthesis glycosyltransferase